MKLDRRLTNGLAWAGALLVVAIPAADYVFARLSDADTPRVAIVDAQNDVAVDVPRVEDTPQPLETTPAPAAETAAPAPEPEPVQTAAVEPTARPEDAVQSYLDSGRALPSYLTGGGSAPQPSAPTPAAPSVPAASTPAPVETPVAAPPPTQTAAVPSAAEPVSATPTTPRSEIETVAALPPKVAPVPMPLSMRPRAVVTTAPQQPPLIVDEPAPVVANGRSDLVTADDLEAWESGPLSDFLAQRQQGSSAAYRIQPNQNAYDSGGFWLDELQSDRRQPQNFPQAYDDSYYQPFSR